MENKAIFHFAENKIKSCFPNNINDCSCFCKSSIVKWECKLGSSFGMLVLFDVKLWPCSSTRCFKLVCKSF